MSGWLKAGLIGVAILVVLSLIGLVSVLKCITIPLTLVTYVVVGVLAASYMSPKREAGAAAGQGALAALVAGFGGGVIDFIINLIRTATGRVYPSADILRQIPPEAWAPLRDLGIGPEVLTGVGGLGGIGIAAVCGSLCCLTGIIFAAVLGAIGGALYAAVKPD